MALHVHDDRHDDRHDDIALLNREAWTTDATLRFFRGYEGWTDPGEAAAFQAIAATCRDVPILDIGVGAGRTVPIFRSISRDYHAIDYSQPMVDLCRAKHPDADVSFGDARDLSRFADGSLGLVAFSWNGIDAVDHEDRQKVLAEVLRVLRPGGVFFFSTHNMQGAGHSEKPWTVRPADLAHPRHLAKLAVHFPKNFSNHRRRKGLNEDHGDWSMTNAAAHHFMIVIHYTTLRRQLGELDAAGFAPDPLVFESRRGARVRPDDDTRRSWWFHILATKP